MVGNCYVLLTGRNLLEHRFIGVIAIGLLHKNRHVPKLRQLELEMIHGDRLELRIDRQELRGAFAAEVNIAEIAVRFDAHEPCARRNQYLRACGDAPAALLLKTFGEKRELVG